MCEATTSYIGKIWLLRSAGHGASGYPDALLWLPRRSPPSRSGLSHSKHRVRAAAALTADLGWDEPGRAYKISLGGKDLYCVYEYFDYDT